MNSQFNNLTKFFYFYFSIFYFSMAFYSLFLKKRQTFFKVQGVKICKARLSYLY